MVHESQLGNGSCPAQEKRFLIKKKCICLLFLFVRELKLKCESYFDLFHVNDDTNDHRLN